MELKDYLAANKPRGARSKLLALKAEILELEAKDYAYWQIVYYLQAKGIDVSLGSLIEFISTLKIFAKLDDDLSVLPSIDGGNFEIVKVEFL